MVQERKSWKHYGKLVRGGSNAPGLKPVRTDARKIAQIGEYP